MLKFIQIITIFTAQEQGTTTKMPISLRKPNSINPRAERELVQPIDNQNWKDWDQIMEESDQVRTTVKNLEGDFPKPSSHAPDRGVIQYYYHLDADDWYRPRAKENIRGVNTDSDVNEFQGTAQATGKLAYSGTYIMEAPRNNSWEATIVLDDYTRDTRNSSEQGRMIITITPPSNAPSDTADKSFSGENQYVEEWECVDTLPFELSFTTNAQRSYNDGMRTKIADWNQEPFEYPNNIYVKAGSKITIEYSTQEAKARYNRDWWTASNGTVPNEDYTYLQVPDYAGAWETGRSWSVMDFNDELNFNIIFQPDWDPIDVGQLKFYHKPLENPAQSTAEIRIKDTNGQTNPEPFFGQYGSGSPAAYQNHLTDTHIYFSPRRLPFAIADLENRIVQDLDFIDDEFNKYGIQRIMHGANRFPADIGGSAYGAHGRTFAPDPKHFWSVGTVSYFLYMSGARSLRGQSALDYAMYGYEVDWRDWNNVRKNDIAVFKFKGASGGHVGFIRDIDLTTNKIKIAGGNQGNKFKETEYLVDSVDMYLLTVRRNWPDPGSTYNLPGLA